MKAILAPALLAAAGYVGLTHSDKVVDLYRAAYPIEGPKRDALEQCSLNPNFNRLDSADRQSCYTKSFAAIPTPVAVGPSASPHYEYSPSHLPGTDIRRLQANERFAPQVVLPPLPPATAATLPAPAAPSHIDLPVRGSRPPVAAGRSEPQRRQTAAPRPQPAQHQGAPAYPPAYQQTYQGR